MDYYTVYILVDKYMSYMHHNQGKLLVIKANIKLDNNTQLSQEAF